jgi:isoquinoline 1-oxidoreductase subunit beta
MPKRRHFILGTVAALGALTVGWAWLPPRQRLLPATPLPNGANQVALNGWVKVGADNTVTVMMSQAEMGQGVYTGAAMLLAEEIDAAWEQVRFERAPLDKIYNNVSMMVDSLPFHPDEHGALKRGVEWLTAKAMREAPGLIVTGGSSSIKDLWLPMREAGASARAMLIGAAAAQWQVSADECRAEAGRVLHVAGRSASFGELAAAAANQPLPADPVLKDAATFKLIGKEQSRIDSAAKIDGSAGFGLDVRLPGMLYASVVMCPTLGGSVTGFDAAAASQLPGVRKIVKFDARKGGSGGVAAIADTPYHAMQAAKAVNVQWDHGPAASLSSAQIIESLAKQLAADDGSVAYQTGDSPAAMSRSARTLGAEYRVPYLAHATMEPMNCTVQFKDGAATVWTGTQAPVAAQFAAAQGLDIPMANVTVNVPFLGGGFGRRGEMDFVAQAAAIAREAGGAPVQTFWSREQDTTHDFYRPATVARLQAGLDAQGHIVAWESRTAGQSVIHQIVTRMLGAPGVGPDKTMTEGSADLAYAFPAMRASHLEQTLPIPVGTWRGVGHSQNAFFTECFLDEVAHATGQDPLKLRLSLLGHDPRHLRVLQRAAELARWGEPLADTADGAKQARGIALHRSFGSVVAQVAEVSVAPDKTIRVHRVVCVIDCGTAVNPNLIRQQMESGIVYGLTAALYGEITIENGQVQQGNFHQYPVLRMDACPSIETDIIASNAPPEGTGEPGCVVIAPAVANALFTLTGQRLRSLPLKLA